LTYGGELIDEYPARSVEIESVGVRNYSQLYTKRKFYCTDYMILPRPPTVQITQVFSSGKRSQHQQTLFCCHGGALGPAIAGTITTLIRLDLESEYEMVPFVPDSFLGGSYPRLQSLYLGRIPFNFQDYQKLLLSATDLVLLALHHIPH
jgi:hypothetical protein